MRKIIKNISRVFFSLLLIFSIFGVVNVLAAETIFSITDISVKDKSDKVIVNDVSLSGGAIVNDVVFTDKDEYIKYDIKIKNNTSDKYTIKSISDNNDSEYLEYSYDDLSNVKLDGGEEKTFNLTITYIKESSNITILDQEVSLTLTYEKEDGTTGSETITNSGNSTSNNNSNDSIINPKTGDNIYLYIILGLVSIGGLVINTVSNKKLAKGMMVIALTSSFVIPLGVKADSESFVIMFNNNIKDNDFKITYNANGGKFSGNSTSKIIPYSNSEIVKISHTANVSDTGEKLSNYGSEWDDDKIIGDDRGDIYTPHVITIPGATSLTIDIYYGGMNEEYFVCVMHDAIYDYNDFYWDDGTYHEYFTEQDGTYEINGNTVTNIGHDHFVIDGDSASFSFVSLSSEVTDGYGYYATVKAILPEAFETVTNPTRDDYIFKGWYTDPDCTDGNELDLTNISSDVEVYAKWVKKYYIQSGDFDTNGSEVCIFNECFYVIGKDDDTHVKLLAKYNLNVGQYKILSDAEGLQNAKSKKYSDEYVGNMGVKFLSNNTAEINQNYVSLATGTYDTYNLPNNVIKPYVEDYVDYLKTSGANVTGRLLSIYEVDELIQEQDMWDKVSNTDFWLLENVKESNAGQAMYTNNFRSYTYWAITDDSYGVRPVIILDISE